MEPEILLFLPALGCRQCWGSSDPTGRKRLRLQGEQHRLVYTAVVDGFPEQFLTQQIYPVKETWSIEAKSILSILIPLSLKLWLWRNLNFGCN